MKALDRTLDRVDGYQREHAWLGFPVAVAKKFGDDGAGHLAALVAYYAFFSLFPLLMVFTAVLAFVLRGNEELQQTILDSALSQFPLVGEQIRRNIGSITGSGLALGIGIATALWAGMGVTNAMQAAMNSIWDVPVKHRPNFIAARIRSLLMLVVLGTLTVGAALLSGLGGAEGSLSMLLRIVGIAGGIAVNLLLFLLAFRILTHRDVSWGEIFPGATVAAVGWAALQLVGSFFITRQVESAEQRYGEFAVVIGLLVWIYLGAQLTLYAAEINVVRSKRLWPRGLKKDDRTEADERTLAQLAEVEERRPDEKVDVRFEEPGGPEGDGADAARDDAGGAVERAQKALAEAKEAVERAKQAVGTSEDVQPTNRRTTKRR